QASLEGTWTYNSPKVVFESESILAQLGGQIASSKIESTASTYLSKLGMTPGTSTITFNNNGTCVFGLNGRQVQGTYTYNSETSQLTMVGAFGLANVTCYATVKLNELELVFDANSLLSLASKATSSISSGNTLSSLLGNYNGLKIGMAMTR
ncbi:MAG: DUF4923 family protein, partial [Bacteroidaceae bacterium]|nr:DUF4923 family protein [Bacteroidaceae bacterium]